MGATAIEDKLQEVSRRFVLLMCIVARPNLTIQVLLDTNMYIKASIVPILPSAGAYILTKPLLLKV